MESSESDFESESNAPTSEINFSAEEAVEDDPFIPSISEIRRIFNSGRTTWSKLAAKADQFGDDLWPLDLTRPYVSLDNVPSLPARLPRKQFLYGRPLWRVPRLEADRSDCQSIDHGPDHLCENEHERSPNDGTQIISGGYISIDIMAEDPLQCDVKDDGLSNFIGVPEVAETLLVMTMCWAYVLSARLCESQDRRIIYSEHHLQPRATGTFDDPKAIKLCGASKGLVRWLCALLSPRLGWSVNDDGGLPPWASCLTTRLSIVADDGTLDTSSAPDSAEAMHFMMELCRLSGVEAHSQHDDGMQGGRLAPFHAGLCAALMLPFYRYTGLRPRLPFPRLALEKKKMLRHTDLPTTIQTLLHDLSYFMTLSLYPSGVGSVLWSIFWQPDVDCNLVSPWLSAIMVVLEPMLQCKQIGKLLKLFGLRRPRVAFWWLGLFLLGDPNTIDWIRRYARSLNEQYGQATLSAPNLAVSAWTGSQQSFLDGHDTQERERFADTGMKTDDLISNRKVLCCRFHLRTQDTGYRTLAWRPFGCMPKNMVEVDLWPYLESTVSHSYHAFVWYSDGSQYPLSLGFRRETSRYLPNVRDDLDRFEASVSEGTLSPECSLGPSKRSTLQMISHLVKESCGDRNWANSGLDSRWQRHKWLAGWRGLD